MLTSPSCDSSNKKTLFTNGANAWGFTWDKTLTLMSLGSKQDQGDTPINYRAHGGLDA